MNRLRTLRRWLWPKHLLGKLGVLFAGFIVMLAVLYQFALYSSSRRIEAVRQRADALGWPRTLEAFLGPAIPDDENAAVAYEEANTIGVGMMEKLLKEHPQAGTFLLRGGRRADYLDRLAELAAATPGFDAALRQADLLPKVRSNFVFKPKYVESFHYHDNRRFIALAELATSRRLSDEGRGDEAVRRLVRLGRIARKVAECDCFCIALIGEHAVHRIYLNDLVALLANRAYPPATHDEIDKFAKSFENIYANYRLAMHSDKFEIEESERRFGSVERRPYLHLRVQSDLAYMHEGVQRAAECFDLPPPEAHAAFAALQKQAWDRLRHYLPWGRNEGFEHYMAYRANYRFLADALLFQARALRVWNAMSRRRDFSLEAARKAIVELDLRDPFDLEPLRAEIVDGGLQVVSATPRPLAPHDSSNRMVRVFPAPKYRPPSP